MLLCPSWRAEHGGCDMELGPPPGAAGVVVGPHLCCAVAYCAWIGTATTVNWRREQSVPNVPVHPQVRSNDLARVTTHDAQSFCTRRSLFTALAAALSTKGPRNASTSGFVARLLQPLRGRFSPDFRGPPPTPPGDPGALPAVSLGLPRASPRAPDAPASRGMLSVAPGAVMSHPPICIRTRTISADLRATIPAPPQTDNS